MKESRDRDINPKNPWDVSRGVICHLFRGRRRVIWGVWCFSFSFGGAKIVGEDWVIHFGEIQQGKSMMIFEQFPLTRSETTIDSC